MKKCGSCGSTNEKNAKFCTECGVSLPPDLKVEPKKTPSSIPDDLDGTISSEVSATNFAQSLMNFQNLQSQRSADVMFVLDCTSSMGGEIEAIKDAIGGFADTIESQGVRVRVGLIEFRDRLINEQQRVLTFDGEPFTSNARAFRAEVSKLRASGGGDIPESSLDAMMLALAQPYGQANKAIVLITDAPPHIPDRDTKSLEEVIERIKQIKVDQMYLIIRTEDKDSQVYLKLLEGRRGMAFEIGRGEDFRERAEDFKRTLMSLGKTISQATR